MECLHFVAVMYRPQPQNPVIVKVVMLILWLGFCVWMLRTLRRYILLSGAKIAYWESILRLIEKASAFELDRNFVNLGEMRAAAANSVHFWDCLKEIDDDAVPDEAGMRYLAWAGQQERRWRTDRGT